MEVNDEDLFHTKTIFRRHSKGPVMFNGCSPSGDVIIIDNISSIKTYDLTGWYIERQTDSQPYLRYTFTDNFLLPPLTTIELWSSTSTPISISKENKTSDDQSLESDEQEQQQQTIVPIQTKLLTWNTARHWSITRLFNINGCEKAIFSHRILTPVEQAKVDEEE